MYFSKKITVVWLMVALLVTIVAGYAIAGEKTKIVDYEGIEVKVNRPVQRIVCINSSLNELLIVLGAGDRIIGKDKGSNFTIIKDIPIIASSSYRPQIEAVLELEPDLIIADTMLQDDARKKFESFGVPVIVENSSDPNRLYQIIRNLGSVVDNVEKGEKLISFLTYYNNLIKQRLSNLKEPERTRVYWEWRKPYKTANKDANFGKRISLTGGINIAHDLEVKYPVVSSEYVWEKDPEVIIRMSSRGDSLTDMKDTWNELMTRTGLKGTTAVKNNNVHVISTSIHIGVRSLIGNLYYAKWLHPDLFSDISPEQIHKELIKKFYRPHSNVESANCVYPF